MILIAGATGNLGGTIAHTLLAQGRPVRVLVRPGSNIAALEAAGAEAVTGDLKDAASLRAACAGVDVVVTTANSAGRGGEDNAETVERLGNRNLIDAAKAAGVRRFVFVSALGADPASPIPFLRGKGEAEAHLRASGMEHVILEPDLFIEVWVGMLVAAPVLAGQPVTLVREARSRHSMVSRENVAEMAVVAVDHPAATDRTIVMGGPEPLSWRDVVAVFERVLGRPIEIRLVEPGEPLPGLPPVVSQLAGTFEAFETVLDPSEVTNTFGLRLGSVEDFARILASSGTQVDA
jgi:NADH dehydrogenase